VGTRSVLGVPSLRPAFLDDISAAGQSREAKARCRNAGRADTVRLPSIGCFMTHYTRADDPDDEADDEDDDDFGDDGDGTDDEDEDDEGDDEDVETWQVFAEITAFFR